MSPWQTAILVVRSLAGFPRLDVVDLGCGDASVLEALAKDGCRVRGTTFLPRAQDHVREREHPIELAIENGVDLTRPLPLPDAAFDVVLCLEVIEHLEAHAPLVTEVRRILRPGGAFVLTTPNLGRLASRLHFAATGVHLTKERRPTGADGLDKIASFHVRCPDLPVLHWLLWQNGLRVERIEPTIVRRSSRLLAPLARVLRPLVQRALDRFESGRDEASVDLAKWMRSDAYATSEQLCLVARAQ